MELSNRLQAVADMVTTGNRVADIGCDHGYVSIYLIEHHISPLVIAMDVNIGPLEKAKEHIMQHGLLPYIETRLSNGVTELSPMEVDTLLCAGMGGKLMIHILEKGKKIVSFMKEIILQPQSEIHLVRKYLRQIGFFIVEEKMIYEEEKYYPMMRAVPFAMGGPKREVLEDSEFSCFDNYGKLLLENKNPVLECFLQQRCQKVEQLMISLSHQAQQTNKQQLRIKELKKELKEIRHAQSFYHDK